MQPIAESLPFIRDRRLQAMGQTGRVRSPIAPDIPTIEEGGVKGYASTTWYMLAAPAKVPQDVVDTLAEKFDQALRQPDLREKLQNVGVRSEEHTSELQSLMRISYAVFCLKKKNTQHS